MKLVGNIKKKTSLANAYTWTRKKYIKISIVDESIAAIIQRGHNECKKWISVDILNIWLLFKQLFITQIYIL